MCGSEAVPTIRQKISAKKLSARFMLNWPFAPTNAEECGATATPAARHVFSICSICSSA
jgi:hypothetical protein